MERKEKKTYKHPELGEVFLDRYIALQLATEDSPPDQPSGTSSSDSDTSTSSDEEEEPKTKTNNFDENPFQR